MEDDLVRSSRPRRRASEIAELLGGYRQSGQGQRKFCQQRGIGLSTLQNYLRRERVDEKSQELVEVEVVAGKRADAKARSLELITIRGKTGTGQIRTSSANTPAKVIIKFLSKKGDGSDNLSESSKASFRRTLVV